MVSWSYRWKIVYLNSNITFNVSFSFKNVGLVTDTLNDMAYVIL